MKRTLAILLIACGLGASGCALRGTQNNSYYEVQERRQAAKLPGTLAIVMSTAQQTEQYQGRPTSFTGGGTTLTLPIGEITREAARLAAAGTFEGGARVLEIHPVSGYTAQITPRVTGLTYEYNQLKNAGFAVTPTVDLSLTVDLHDSTGIKRQEKLYRTGPYERPAYVYSGQPGEEISRATHKAVMLGMQQAMDDLHRQLSRPQGLSEPPPLPAVATPAMPVPAAAPPPVQPQPIAPAQPAAAPPTPPRPAAPPAPPAPPVPASREESL